LSQPDELIGFIIRQVNGITSCLDATPEEVRRIMRVDPNVRLRQLNHLPKGQSSPRGATFSDEATTAEAATGLKIILRGTDQLNANTEAAAAFTRAAAVWESVITSDITVVIDVDFGTTRFGTAYESGVLGSTNGGVFFIPSYSTTRSRLAARASNSEETGIYNQLPATSVPTDLGVVSDVVVASPIARALGFGGVPPHANPNPGPDPTGPGGKSIDAFGNAPSIGFNSNFIFDFNPQDGITSGTTDFNAVAVHEIGHALGFTSQVGNRELRANDPLRVTIWDLFRFRPATAAGAFASAQRVLSSGGVHVHFDGGAELALSTGRPDGTGGDEHQASHWKDDSITGQFIGIMDPTIARGRREDPTNNDLRALDFLGYQVGPPAPAPANDNFANAVELVGPAGTVTGSSSNATKEAGEPAHAGNGGGHSVWYRWTAPTSGTATFDTVGSTFDTLLAAYTGGTVSALSALTSNDDIQDGVIRASRISFPVTAGMTYRIALDGWNGDFGSITLNWNLVGPSTFFRFGFPDYIIRERDRTATINIIREGDASTSQAVTFATTTGGTATEGADYNPTGARLVFAPGETNKSFNVLVNDDALVEPSETVNLMMHTPEGGAVLGTPGTAVLTINDDDVVFGPNSIQFEGAATREISEGVGVLQLNVKRTGDLTQAASVFYHTANLLNASDRTDYTNTLGTLRFATGESTKTISVFVTDDVYVEADETFGVFLKVPSQATLGSPDFITVTIKDNDTAAGAPNPVDSAQFFVRQHYRDFLNREPDAGGLAFWTNEITSCGSNQQCIDVKRENVSAAFFLSIEFKETGYLVYRMRKAAYGDFPGQPVPVDLQGFTRDTQEIGSGVVVGLPGWGDKLEGKKQAFATNFVVEPSFGTRYPQTLAPAQFVDALNANTGNSLTQAERDVLVAELVAANNTEAGRASVLRKVAENAEFSRRELNRAFVLMQYFGYMRRNPNNFPDSDFRGYNFWLGKLNDNNGNFVQAQMVQAFITSIEYRNRFAP
jgi:hypothetical protein